MDVEQPNGRARRSQRGTADRMPRRSSDRVEDAVAWLFSSLALLTVVVACVVGVTAAGTAAERARIEARERVPVRVILLEPAEVLPAADGTSLPTPIEVRARWILPDGSERTAPVTTAVRSEAGAELRKWVDTAGRPVSPPMSSTTGLLESVLAGVAIALGGWLTLLVTWWGLRGCTGARNAARWTREWRQVEPVWSGRLPWQ